MVCFKSFITFILIFFLACLSGLTCLGLIQLLFFPG